MRNLLTFNTVIWTTYVAIYMTDRRGIGLADSTIAIFPFISAVVTMAMILLASRRTPGKQVFGNLVVGQLLSVVACLCMVASPSGTIWWAILWSVGSAVSVALVQTRQ